MGFQVFNSVSPASKVTLLVQMLLVIAFCALAIASSIIDTARKPPGSKLIEGSANSSWGLEDLNLLHTRAGSNVRPNAVFEKTCSEAQVTYIHTALGETADLAFRAYTATVELLEIMQNKEEPSTWSPATYTRKSRNFLLWNSFFGQIALGKESGKVSQRSTITTMKEARDIFREISKKLSATSKDYRMIINCADDWLVNTGRTDAEGNRTCQHYISLDSARALLKMDTGLYHDTRTTDHEFIIKHQVTCHESPTVRAYVFHHETDDGVEMVYCPRMFDLWGGKRLATIQSSSFQSLKGQRMTDMKNYAAAGTVFHEHTHSKGILGEKYTEDLSVVYKGEEYKVYGSLLVREFAKVFVEGEDGTGIPIQNADTLAYFALGVYFNQCNWANPVKPGKCAGDSPDRICPTDENGNRNCATFFD